ncbi:ATP-binding protein [Streptomyces sp. ATCC51928]|uniref:ATP-binding protein n=1 Tax=Streptomyces caviscabies TaxID=90079 RepID=A0ABW2MHC1_9ACTN|nr:MULTISPECIES: ATP-binding protein [unclassified Streptomyces]MCL6292605.1 ATP-binding protein [Streptomyces sp. 43Y-GA-1]MDX3500534.1 ATP-binding protein [Streptomyces sp. ATCC51928]MDX5520595.1 ATP-binding protein [Streptomyces sp. DE06-01C]QXQ98154.1 ATP-binding protein [Streptomyces sp. WY228]
MRHRQRLGRFPVQPSGASNPWRGAKEVSGVALVVAQEVPASSSMAIPHGPAGVGQARHRMREQLRGNGVSDAVVDDAVLILSELLSNACRHGRPLGRQTDVGDGDIRAAWRVDTGGALTVEVTDGGGPTRPVPATPSVTARGGRGLNIISALAQEWGVRDDSSGEVTVWALVSAKKPPGIGGGNGSSEGSGSEANGVRANGVGGLTGFEGLDFSEAFDDVG